MERDFATISPSAMALILMKGHTTIPFAREAATIISAPSVFSPDFENTDVAFWSRVFHFEARYRGIDQLLEGLQIRNFLELSSGYSFRGLELVRKREAFFLDTDLPELIAQKKRMLESLDQEGSPGKLELLPLNALDEEEFRKGLVARLPPGELAILNEGLLVYLDEEEKKKLCGIIRRVLEERGGYWITSDIYIRLAPGTAIPSRNSGSDEFMRQHRIEEKKFASLKAAQSFFENNGFTIDREEDLDLGQVSSLTYLARAMKTPIPTPRAGREKMQTSWRLKLAT